MLFNHKHILFISKLHLIAFNYFTNNQNYKYQVFGNTTFSKASENCSQHEQ